MKNDKRLNHADWTKFDPRDLRPMPSYMKNPVPCPVCKCHTVCITTENAYGEGVHQKLSCGQCGSMSPLGWVEAGSKDATCAHDFTNGVKVGNCLYTYTCAKCGQTQTIDSGD